MTGNLAQLVWLTSHGNEFLINGNLPDANYLDNDVFQFVNTVNFHNFKKGFFSSKIKDSIAAENPIAWFKLLKKEKCNRLRLYYRPTGNLVVDGTDFGDERMMAGFVGGGGEWLIESIYKGYSNYWGARMEVTRRDDPNNKIWAYNYARKVERFATTNTQYDIVEMREKLSGALINIAAYANGANLKMWADIFERALSVLNGQQVGVGYSNLLVEKNYKPEASRLLYAASAAWVFGGMGSWNDVGEDSKEYSKFSNELYIAINLSIVAATNSF